MKTEVRTPCVTVLLPVYNGEKYIAEAVGSVLSQTFADFELIVIDDGSTDRSAGELQGFSDARLRIIRLPAHCGLVAALNHGIRESHSALIARMDADDICMPRRFERQVAFMDSHPEIELCGTWTRQFGDEDGVRRPPEEPERIRARLFFGWAMDHPSIMIRRSFLDRHDLAYDDEFRHVEDYDLFLRAADRGNLANLPEVLLRTRAHPGETSVVHEGEQVQTEARLQLRQLRILMPGVTRNEEDLHLRMLNGDVDAERLPMAVQWLSRLDQANLESARYDVKAFREELGVQTYRLHYHTAGSGLRILSSYRDASFADRSWNRVAAFARLVARFAFVRVLRAARACRMRLRRRAYANRRS